MIEKPIRILIADDHTVVRQGLRTMLEPKADILLIGEAVDGQDAINQAISLKPDVILMDLVMPIKDGMEAISEIVRILPETRILVLTSFSEEDRVITAIRAGARGYMLKDSSPQDLVQAIRDVYQGKMFLYPGMVEKVVHKLLQPQPTISAEPLTEREIDVLRLVAGGLTNLEIAEKLQIGEGTVRFHINNILAKLNLNNRTQAALYAIREGIASLYL
jgi:NarL family two-component system response regulator LiaR